MKLKLLLFVLVLAVITALPARAQLSGHEADLTWVASPTPNATYTVYRGLCTGTVDATAHTCSAEASASAIISGLAPLAYNDTAVTAGGKYYWYVTAVVDTPTGHGESVPSNHWAAVIPKDVIVVSPPTGLTGTTK